MKVYFVYHEYWRGSWESDFDDCGLRHVFATKDLAVEYIVQQIEYARQSLLGTGNFCNRPKLIERATNFVYNIDELKRTGRIQIAALTIGETFGNNDSYMIEEHEVLEELPKDD